MRPADKVPHGNRYLHCVQQIRKLEFVNNYLLLKGAYDGTIDRLVEYCVKINSKKMLARLCYVLFSGIRKSHDFCASKEDFIKMTCYQQLYKSLTNSEYKVEQSAIYFRETFKLWSHSKDGGRMGFISKRTDVVEEWANLEVFLQMSSVILWKKQDDLTTVEAVADYFTTIKGFHLNYSKKLAVFSKFTGEDNKHFKQLTRVNEQLFKFHSLNEEKKKCLENKADANTSSLKTLEEVSEQLAAIQDDGLLTCSNLFRVFEDARQFLTTMETIKFGGGSTRRKYKTDKYVEPDSTQEFLDSLVGKTTFHAPEEFVVTEFPRYFGEAIGADPDEVITIMSGGGNFHLLSFLLEGKSRGYKPDDEETISAVPKEDGTVPAIYVAMKSYQGPSFEWYARRESKYHFDHPAVFTARIARKHLWSTVRHPSDEALLTKDKIVYLQDVKVEPLSNALTNSR